MLLSKDEKIEYEINANLKKGVEFVGGKLTITNERFCFESHLDNVQKPNVTFEISEIEKLNKSNALGIVPNAIKVRLSDNSSYTFIIGFSHKSKRKEIIQYIKTLM